MADAAASALTEEAPHVGVHLAQQQEGAGADMQAGSAAGAAADGAAADQQAPAQAQEGGNEGDASAQEQQEQQAAAPAAELAEQEQQQQQAAMDEEEQQQEQQAPPQDGATPPQEQLQHEAQEEQPEAPAAQAQEQQAAGRATQEQLSYAAVREAAAINQAAETAAEEAMRAVASAQHTIQAMLHPATRPEDDAGSSRSGRGGRGRRGPAAYMEDGYGLTNYHHSRQNKGLRHFSMKVCEKVEVKGTTTYNEVADELVAELQGAALHDDNGVAYDEKNIRRRVYDAINVLMALDIIAKEKKAIIWRGFPTARGAAQQVHRLQTEQLAAMSEVGRKTQFLADLVEQQKALRHLLERNAGCAEPTGTAMTLPFILVQSKPEATVEVQISPDMRDVQFSFQNHPFEIHDDALVLRKMLEHDNLQKLAAVAHGHGLAHMGYHDGQGMYGAMDGMDVDANPAAAAAAAAMAAAAAATAAGGASGSASAAVAGGDDEMAE